MRKNTTAATDCRECVNFDGITALSQISSLLIFLESTVKKSEKCIL